MTTPPPPPPAPALQVPAPLPRPAAVQGPALPLPSGLPRNLAPRAWEGQGLRNLLSSLPGAVVVVEDWAPVMTPTSQGATNVGVVKFNLSKTLPRIWATIAPDAVPPWMDTSVTRAGGNTAGKVYTIGSASF